MARPKTATANGADELANALVRFDVIYQNIGELWGSNQIECSLLPKLCFAVKLAMHPGHVQNQDASFFLRLLLASRMAREPTVLFHADGSTSE
jgi:hypothetical protein